MVWLVAYCFFALLVWRPVTGHIAWRYLIRSKKEYPALYARTQEPDSFQWFAAGCVAALLVSVWPVAGVVWLTGHLAPIGAERKHVHAKQLRVVRGYVWFVRRFGLVRLVRYQWLRHVRKVKVDYEKVFDANERAQLEEHGLAPWSNR